MRSIVRLDGAMGAGRILRTTTAVMLVAAGAARAQSASPAQPSTDSRWTPWLGCWQQEAATPPDDRAGSRVTCNVPVSGTAAAIQSLSIVNGRIASRRRIDAGGRPHAIDQAGCSGTEMGKFGVVGR